jgi:hypothetical protein
MAEMHISYRIGDATSTGLPPGSIDLFVSNNVFEHVPREELGRILVEQHRVGSPGALLSHHIDLRDHYAKVDRRISVYHMLRFSSRAWWWLNSRMEPQNRLRQSDYLRLLDDTGFELLSNGTTTGSSTAYAAARRNLAREFEGYAEDDLAVINMWIAARKRE